MSADFYYAPDVLVDWLQEFAAFTGEAFGRGLIDEEEYRRSLRADREDFLAELAKALKHQRLRTGQEQRQSYAKQYFFSKLAGPVLRAREEVRDA